MARILLACAAVVALVAEGLLAEVPAVSGPHLSGPLVVEPAAIKLTHRRDPYSLLVAAQTVDGLHVDLTHSAELAAADADVVQIRDGLVWPLASGKTTVRVRAAGLTAEVPVEVQLPEAGRPWSFRHEVMPVLTKSGCNMGACHGYSLGKNGFKLSLRGSDPDDDYAAITGEYFGRRIDRLAPAASLVLTKPLGVAPHKGGVRFAAGSLPQQILQSWIEAGTPGDLDDQARVESVQIRPEKVVTTPGSEHQFQLIARYNDGRLRDVTRLAVFSANNENFAEIDEAGKATAVETGETALVARFARKFAAAQIIVLREAPNFEPTPVPTENLVDKHVVAKLNDLRIRPSQPASDAEYLRRVYVDLIGLQPTPDEVRAFLADTDPNKRNRVLDGLFDRPEFVDHWSLKWGDLLQNSRDRVSEPAMYAFREWIRGAIAANMPLDEFASQILTAAGRPSDHPASAYFASSVDTNDTLERATQVFCGVRMLCAKCHAHPFENWTQADYYGLASFFNQVSVKGDPKLVNGRAERNAKMVVFNPDAGYARNPRSGQLQPPRFLGGGEAEIDPQADRRAVYARWLTSAENRLFARSLTNRIWSYFFHRGIIEPVDDVRSTNPPVNAPLLDALTADFVASGFDARHLMRRIVTSETYQRSSVANDTNRDDELNFSRAVPRRLSAESLLDCLVQATGVPERFGGAPAGFTAAQLPDANIKSEFLGLFGKPQRMEACECERDDGSNMLQALHFINGSSILSRVSNPSGRVAGLLKRDLDDAQLTEELYLWALARLPSPQEQQIAEKFLKSYENRTEAAQDLMWALLNSRNFVLLH